MRRGLRGQALLIEGHHAIIGAGEIVRKYRPFGSGEIARMLMAYKPDAIGFRLVCPSANKGDDVYIDPELLGALDEGGHISLFSHAFYLHICIILAYIVRMNRITVSLTNQQLIEIQAIVASTGLKFAEVLRRIVDKGLEESEPSHWARRKRALEKEHLHAEPQGARDL